MQVNLATVNYILFRLQSFFHAFSAICCDPGILESISAGANAAAQEDLYRDQLRQTCIALKEKGPKRFDLWKKWLDFIGEAEEVRLSQLLAWGMEENKDSIKTVAPCFLETWWNEVIVKYEVLEFIKNQKTAGTWKDDLKEELASDLQNVFMTRVENILWDFVKSNANPVGLFIGSDKQGGAHQEESNPATNWPNDYVGTIQLTGKSRRASNIWNRECGFSSGHSLGYKMTRMQVNKNNVEFQLSSNPNTATTVKTCDTDVLFPMGKFSLLTPSVHELERANPSGSRNYALTNPTTFWRFACSNQLSKPMNLPCDSRALALNAIAMGNSPPIEVIMRRTFNDHRDVNQYWSEKTLSATVKKVKNTRSRVVPSYAEVPISSDEVEDMESAEDTTTAATAPFKMPKEPASKKKGEKKPLL